MYSKILIYCHFNKTILADCPTQQKRNPLKDFKPLWYCLRGSNESGVFHPLYTFNTHIQNFLTIKESIEAYSLPYQHAETTVTWTFVFEFVAHYRFSTRDPHWQRVQLFKWTVLRNLKMVNQKSNSCIQMDEQEMC